MTPTESYLSSALDLDKLTEDEQNGIVAKLEGWTRYKDQGEWTHHNLEIPDDINAFEWKAPDYLNSWELCGPLIEKYHLQISEVRGYQGWYATQYYGIGGYVLRQLGELKNTPQAAIVHAVCEIAKEKENEESNSSASNS